MGHNLRKGKGKFRDHTRASTFISNWNHYYNILFCLTIDNNLFSLQVETSDHARLKIALAMNNAFRVRLIRLWCMNNTDSLSLSLSLSLLSTLYSLLSTLSLYSLPPPPPLRFRRVILKVKPSCSLFQILLDLLVEKLVCIPIDWLKSLLSSYPFTASRIRGTVASVPFEQFHKFSADIITAAVFGKTADGTVKSELLFKANNLVSQTLN